jgi:hypothetical protein
MHYFELTIVGKTLLVVAIVVSLGGCAASTPAVQWWRVGECLVVYDDRDENRHVVVAGGQQCDIKRQDLTNGHGVTRATSR